jgi:hypothetical protein
MSQHLEQLSHVFRAVVLATFADGQPSVEELKLLKELMALHPEFGRLHKPQALVLETFQLIKEKGTDALLDEIAQGLPERAYQELAYKLASRVIAADGVTAPGEAVLLTELKKRFGFTQADVLLLLAT